MKNLFIGLLLVSAFYFLSSFSSPQSPNGKKVGIKDWKESLFLLPNNYWNDGIKEPEIVKQVGKETFEKMKIYSNAYNIPCEFLIFCEDRDGSPKKDMDSLAAKLSKLVIYRFATFIHYGKKRNESITIVAVPYQDNKNWDVKAKWDTVYFLAPTDLVVDAK